MSSEGCHVAPFIMGLINWWLSGRCHWGLGEGEAGSSEWSCVLSLWLREGVAVRIQLHCIVC